MQHERCCHQSLRTCLQLAETRWGVIPIQYRPVPCDYKPQHMANQLANPTPGWQPSWGQ